MRPRKFVSAPSERRRNFSCGASLRYLNELNLIISSLCWSRRPELSSESTKEDTRAYGGRRWGRNLRFLRITDDLDGGSGSGPNFLNGFYVSDLGPCLCARPRADMHSATNKKRSALHPLITGKAPGSRGELNPFGQSGRTTEGTSSHAAGECTNLGLAVRVLMETD